MRSADEFPYLRDMLGAYFHQDAFASGDTVDTIVADFKASSWDYQRLGVRADVRRLLHEEGGHLLATLQNVFSPHVTIGGSDAEVRTFLETVDAALNE